MDRLINVSTPLSSSALDALDALCAASRSTRAALVRAAVAFALASPDRSWTQAGYRRPGRPSATSADPRQMPLPHVASPVLEDEPDEVEEPDTDGTGDEVVDAPRPVPAGPPSILDILDHVGIAEDGEEV